MLKWHHLNKLILSYWMHLSFWNWTFLPQDSGWESEMLNDNITMCCMAGVNCCTKRLASDPLVTRMHKNIYAMYLYGDHRGQVFICDFHQFGCSLGQGLPLCNYHPNDLTDEVHLAICKYLLIQPHPCMEITWHLQPITWQMNSKYL